MLDIDKLDKQFDEILSSFSEEKIQQWIDFAEERETMECLFNGESVNISMEKLKPKYVIVSNSDALFEKAGENNYALAA
ncbi:hypothetical protein SAMN04487989_10171 [Bizionia echini]|uniref:Uncharacterized protein n=1 Tax=Bizionia echini TaxID=649333 RepID=A0A1I4YKQ2_9FLAO|nr:hypothetical protein [Bizionia echini]SFN38363.1 hypothetical protein SAMN04487989_10171 [Bizionia echini]